MKRTIKEVSAAWLNSKLPYVKQSTAAAYMLMLENHILPYFGRHTDLTEKKVQQFVSYKLNNGLSVKSVKDMLIIMKTIMKFGNKNGWNEYHEWDVKYPTTDNLHRPEVLTAKNHKKIIDYINKNISFRNIGIYISLTTGMRIGEICALKWEDIDDKNWIISVKRTVERIYITENGKKQTKIIINTPKTKNSYREIPMSNSLIKIIRPLKKIMNNDYFIISNKSKPTEPRTYRNYYYRLIKRIDIPKIKFHGLRHSFATRCIESNCDYKTVSALLGHSNIATTLNLYVHPNMEQKRRCINKMLKSIEKS